LGGGIILAQQFTSHVLFFTGDKTIVEKPVLDNPNTQTKSSAGTSLQILQDICISPPWQISFEGNQPALELIKN